MKTLMTLFTLGLACTLNLAYAAQSEVDDDGHYLMFYSPITNETTAIRFDGEAWRAIEGYNAGTVDYPGMMANFYRDKRYPRFEMFRGTLPSLMPLAADHRGLEYRHGHRESAALRVGLGESLELYIVLAPPFRAEYVYPETAKSFSKEHPLGTLTWIDLPSDEIKKRTSVLTVNREKMSVDEFQHCQAWLKGEDTPPGVWRLLRFAR